MSSVSRKIDDASNRDDETWPACEYDGHQQGMEEKRCGWIPRAPGSFGLTLLKLEWMDRDLSATPDESAVFRRRYE